MMSETSADQDAYIRQAADQLFIEAKHQDEFTRDRVLQLAGVGIGQRAFHRVFPGNQFILLRQSWLLQRIENAMTTAFAAANEQREVTMKQIAGLAGCHYTTVSKLAGSQFYARLQTLPDSEQRVLREIERLVEAKVPLQDYTLEHVYAEVGARSARRLHNKIIRAFRTGHDTLTRYHEQHEQQQRVPNATYASIQGNWINVDESVWYLAPLEITMRRDRLRPDIVTIAWPMLREEALTPSTRAGTLHNHYDDCLLVAKLLGDTIPDIRALTLAALQQAWLRSEASFEMRKRARTMLVRMLETLIAQSTAEDAQNVHEYALGLQWLQMIRLWKPASDKIYLSEEEFDKVINYCLEDIMQGLAYTQHLGSIDGQVTADLHTHHAEPMWHWGTGLIILVMAFTGLRRQSIARLTIEDIAQIGPQVFALTWRHGRPNKQRIAIIPALVAEYLQHYIHATELVRVQQGTQRIFFARDKLKRWTQMTVLRLDYACEIFDSRHSLARDGTPLRIGSTILRRTYVTRALYELPNIAALQAQLGHNDASTTLAYAQHERYEHPEQVDGALDAFGRKVLTRWYKPLLLNNLPDTERKALLADRIAHEQDVGMCRHNCCVKLSEDHLPPCSLCEHLVSGPEYLAAWEHEKVLREQQLERLAKTPGAELLLAQMKGQYDRFLANYWFVQERSHL